MGERQSQILKEATWRNHLACQAVSGKSIAAFCRDEAISVGNFYAWRSKLRSPAELPAPAGGATFIDVGAVNSAIAGAAPDRSPAPVPLASPSFDVWKQMFAANPLRSDLHDLCGRFTHAVDNRYQRGASAGQPATRTIRHAEAFQRAFPSTVNQFE